MRRSLCLYGCMGILVFCVLTGRLNGFSVCMGALAGMGAGWYLCRLKRPGLFRPRRIFRYGLFMIREILTSAVRLTAAVFQRKSLRPRISRIPVHLPQGGDIIVSNSITLTPGTVTLEEDGREYTVLYLEKDSEEQIRGGVEQMERRLEVRGHD